jgi:hypothetical protein
MRGCQSSAAEPRKFESTNTLPERVSIFLGVLRRELCLLTTAEFRMPSLKSGAQLVIEDVHPHLQ